MGCGEKFLCGTMTKCNQEVAYMAFVQVGSWSTFSAGKAHKRNIWALLVFMDNYCVASHRGFVLF